MISRKLVAVAAPVAVICCFSSAANAIPPVQTVSVLASHRHLSIATYNPLGYFPNVDGALMSTAASIGVTNAQTYTVSWWQWGQHVNPSSTNDTKFANTGGYSTNGANCESPHDGFCAAFDNSGAFMQNSFLDASGAGPNISGTGSGVMANQVWTHYLFSINLATGNAAVYVNNTNARASGLFTVPTIASVTPDLNAVGGFGLLNGHKLTDQGWGYQADFFLSTDDTVCKGTSPITVGGISYACAAANTVPAALLAKFISPAGAPVDPGSTCANPTNRQPELCFAGSGSDYLVNKGFATNISGANAANWAYVPWSAGAFISPAPYGPLGIPAGQPTMRWHQGRTGAGAGLTTITTDAASSPIVTGELLVITLVGQDSSGTGNHSLSCPTGGTTTFTALGPEIPAGQNTNSIICYGVIGAGETGAYAFSWTGAFTKTVGWQMSEYANVSAVDTAASGAQINASSTTCQNPNLTTSVANETVVSWCIDSNAVTKTFGPPPNGFNQQRIKSVSGPEVMINTMYKVGLGGSTSNPITMSAADASAGYTLGLKP